MKITHETESDVHGGLRHVLKLESDDGLYACNVIDFARFRDARAREKGMIWLATVAVQEMFDAIDSRRRQQPEIGATMKLRNGTGAPRVVYGMNKETRELWFAGESMNSDPGTPWADVEYAS